MLKLRLVHMDGLRRKVGAKQRLQVSSCEKQDVKSAEEKNAKRVSFLTAASVCCLLNGADFFVFF